MKQFEELKEELLRLPDTANERSLYPSLVSFLSNYANDTYKSDGYHAVAEESSNLDDSHIGFPDITTRKREYVVGWIEVKPPKDTLSSPRFREQFMRYKSSFQNLIITNLIEWQLWQWDEEGKPSLESSIVWDPRAEIVDKTKVDVFLKLFLEGIAYEVRTPKQLAIALARKTQLLSRQVEETLELVAPEHRLIELKKTFEQTLVNNLKPHQFSNMVAETIAYSLFLAKLEHENRNDNGIFDTHAARRYLPRNVPILKDLYELVLHVANDLPSISHGVQSLVDQLNLSDIERVRRKLVTHREEEDPVIQFYEPFLAEYDPAEREARGVYYTPKPIVDYIIKSVDWLLQTRFNKASGLADSTVNLLDPSAGTGTFLMAAVQEIFKKVSIRNEGLGSDLASKEFDEVVLNHILKHFYGFELLMAPYAVAHLKLTLELERLGFNFEKAYEDGSPENDRFKVYLANTLDDPNTKPKSLFGYDAIPEESEQARKVKTDEPVLAIIGNPPYSNFGQMNREAWILDLLRDYKKDLNETKINLDDDFIKFIRFAQWKIEKTGQGIFAMITSSTFLDGITHRQMRKVLLDVFDEIFIYNLHGSTRKGENAPEGINDENVFNIQQGVSINFFIKNPESSECTVKSADLWGSQKDKFEKLKSTTIVNTQWKELDINAFNSELRQTKWGKDFHGDLNFFVEKGAKNMLEYGNFYGIKKAFNIWGSGVKTDRDELSYDFDKTLLTKKMEMAFSGSYENSFKEKYNINNSTSYNFKSRLDENEFDQNAIITSTYRPFDFRYLYYKVGFTSRPSFDTARHMLKPNLGLCLMRTIIPTPFNQVLVTNNVIDVNLFGFQSYLFPLYIYEQDLQQTLLEPNEPKKANFTAPFLEEYASVLGLSYINNGRGDLITTFGPEDLFYVIYSILHSGNYRNKFEELLEIDFARIPVVRDLIEFKSLARLGRALVNLHLLGDNPFDKSETIFDKPREWFITAAGPTPEGSKDWEVTESTFDELKKQVSINKTQYFEGIDSEVWNYSVGGQRVLEKWLKERKKVFRSLSVNDLKHFMKVAISIRETIIIQAEIDKTWSP